MNMKNGVFIKNGFNTTNLSQKRFLTPQQCCTELIVYHVQKSVCRSPSTYDKGFVISASAWDDKLVADIFPINSTELKIFQHGGPYSLWDDFEVGITYSFWTLLG